jgi:hypothetical protein
MTVNIVAIGKKPKAAKIRVPAGNVGRYSRENTR